LCPSCHGGLSNLICSECKPDKGPIYLQRRLVRILLEKVESPMHQVKRIGRALAACIASFGEFHAVAPADDALWVGRVTETNDDSVGGLRISGKVSLQ